MSSMRRPQPAPREAEGGETGRTLLRQIRWQTMAALTRRSADLNTCCSGRIGKIRFLGPSPSTSEENALPTRDAGPVLQLTGTVGDCSTHQSVPIGALLPGGQQLELLSSKSRQDSPHR
jgi:hypothetical protein